MISLIVIYDFVAYQTNEVAPYPQKQTENTVYINQSFNNQKWQTFKKSQQQLRLKDIYVDSRISLM